jgi:D-alanine-D-alanine ligase
MNYYLNEVLMPLKKAAAALPVLLIANVDPSWAPFDQDEVFRETNRLGAAMEELGHPVRVVPIAGGNLAVELAAFDPEDHIVFNWCESLPGISYSEALVAETLESLGFVYTGADSRALALSQDKARVKNLLAGHAIPTPRWQLYEDAQVDGWEGFPAIVKPVSEHCSIGITSEAVVLNKNELRQRVRYVLDTLRQPALAEDFVDGREFRVSFWGDEHLAALPVAEMDFSAFPEVRQRLCTYDSKFVPDSLHYRKIETLLPAPLLEDEVRRLCETALAAYSVVGCRDYGRIDLRLRDDVFYVLDVNPNPDISADASMACAAELAGFSYGALGSCLVALAACRHQLFKHQGAALLNLLRNRLPPS